MKALPQNYRFVVLNGSGVSIANAGDATVKARRFKLDNQGALVYEGSEGSAYSNAGSISNNSYDVGTTLSNATGLYLGGDFLFSVVIGSGSPSGRVDLILERSTDGGTTWDTHAEAEVVASIAFTSTGTKRVSLSL